MAIFLSPVSLNTLVSLAKVTLLLAFEIEVPS